MTASQPASVVAHGDRSIRITRAFSAPRPLVFDAFTQPKLIQRWMGHFDKWSWISCDVDLRVGGAYRYAWKHPDGMELILSGVYREVSPPERIVCTQTYEGMSEFGEMLVTITLTERDGQTHLEEFVEYPSPEARDTDLQQAPEGIEPGFALLDQVLASH